VVSTPVFLFCRVEKIHKKFVGKTLSKVYLLLCRINPAIPGSGTPIITDIFSLTV
jgi:hypothetical protein